MQKVQLKKIGDGQYKSGRFLVRKRWYGPSDYEWKILELNEAGTGYTIEHGQLHRLEAVRHYIAQKG